jgi:cytosine/adenosine deaminase-related metal-dependent hydrolase
MYRFLSHPIRSLPALVVLLLAFAAPQARAQTPAKLLITNAYIFTMAPTQREPFHGYLVVAQDGRLTTVAAGDPPTSLKAQTTWNASGHWITPGFISAHSHLWQSAYRGLAADQTLLGWIDDLYGQKSAHATAEDLYWFTLEGSLDHLRHGITAAYNFSLGGHTPDESLAFNQQEFRAELDSGIRFVHGWQPGHSGQINDEAETRTHLKQFLDASAKQRQDRHFLSVMINGMTSFVPADQAPNEARMEAALMREFHLANETHYLEPPNTQTAERSLFPLFAQNGMLGPNLIFGHFIHTTPDILAATGKAGASMSWNPLSNGRLASGTADIPAYLKAGIRVGMGVDGEASADLADPFENLRTGLYAIRDKYEDATIMSPYDVFRLHTMGSADVLNEADRLGSLEPGKFADFLVIDPTHFGVVFDPYATLVLVTSQPDLERVYVGGQLEVDHGKLLHQDLIHVEAEVNRRVAPTK